MNRRLHHWMTRSALAATLALVLVPTLGRLVGLPPMPVHHVAMHSAAPDTGDEDGATPASHGHALTHVGAQHAGANDAGYTPDPTGNGHPGLGEDCGYCALLLGTASLPIPKLHTRLPRRSIAVAALQTRTATPDRHPTGLGSRGPPLAG